jgi:hypothetical protein
MGRAGQTDQGETSVSGFKRTPLPPEELTAALRNHASGLPSATATPSGRPNDTPGRRGEVRQKAPKTVQVNFSCTEDMARLIAQLAAGVGSTRRMFARLLRDAGHSVPFADLNPADNRRRWSDE